jgi:WD40 repeat protein
VFSPDSRLVAAVAGPYDPSRSSARIWEVASGELVDVVRPVDGDTVYGIAFTADGRVLTVGRLGLRRWDLGTGGNELLYEGRLIRLAATADGAKALVVEKVGDTRGAWGRAVLIDLETDAASVLTSHGDRVGEVAIDALGKLVATSGVDEVIRVGPVTGEEPHLLLGHEGKVHFVAVDPLGRWVASTGQDMTIRLWPMPDLSKPPLHTLPRSELIAKLETLTNLRVVRDRDSATGWTLTHDPFPGWETVPTW